ncbi:MAG: glycosyltransferase [Cytophagales bacterium]|nr:glycosyltransferase [Armatimonadota bacterium]
MTTGTTSALLPSQRVLFVSGTPLGSATCRYRCEHLAEALRAQGARAEVAYVGQSRVRVAHEVVVLYRVCATGEGRRFARAARACGATLVYSTDDLVFDAEAAPPEMGSRFRALAPLHREMLIAADAALASTEFLARRMQEAAPGVPVRTLRNFLGGELFARSRAAASQTTRGPVTTVTLGYLSGTPTHDADLALIAEPLRQVLRANPLADLLLVGPIRTPEALMELEAAGRVRRRATVAWQDLPALIIEEKIAINLAPLDLSRPFCHAKSEVKFLEAAALGIPTVASAGEGFAEGIPTESASEGDEGLVLLPTPNDWMQALTSLIQNEERRQSLGERAWQRVRLTGTMEANAPKVAAFFDTLTGGERLSARTIAPPETMVNWPFAPRYAVKSLLQRMSRR